MSDVKSHTGPSAHASETKYNNVHSHKARVQERGQNRPTNLPTTPHHTTPHHTTPHHTTPHHTTPHQHNTTQHNTKQTHMLATTKRMTISLNLLRISCYHIMRMLWFCFQRRVTKASKGVSGVLRQTYLLMTKKTCQQTKWVDSSSYCYGTVNQCAQVRTLK